MPRGCPCTGKARCVSVKLRQETHKSWVEAKRYFHMNTNDTLANRLLKLATPSTTVTSKVSSNSNVPETNHDACYLSIAVGSQYAVSDMTQR